MLLNHSTFFDIETFPQAKIFEKCEFPWELIPLIGSYLSSLLLGKIKGNVSSQAYLINPDQIFIDEGTVVEPGAYIAGPCWIGKNCTIRQGAYIRGQLIAGNHCVIGHDTEVKNAIFLNEAHAAHFAYVGDSILGNKVNLGAGVKCANIRFDQKPIGIHFQNKKIATGLRKLGAIVGDGGQIGCNCVTNPGTLIGKEVRCFPSLNIEGVIPARSMIKPSLNPIISSY